MDRLGLFALAYLVVFWGGVIWFIRRMYRATKERGNAPGSQLAKSAEMGARPVWHLSRSGKQYGPISHDELLRRAGLGQLRPDDFLWGPEFTAWAPASSIPGLLNAPGDAQPASVARKAVEVAALCIATLVLVYLQLALK
jgi:hypothetical protein